MGRGSKVVQMVPVAPRGAQGEGPQGAKHCKFQTSSSPDLEVGQSSYIVCRYLNKWRIKVVHDRSWGGPLGPLWGVTNWGVGHFKGKGGILSSASKCMVRFYSNLVGIMIMGGRWIFYWMVPIAPMGAQGEGLQGAKHCKFQTSSSSDLEVEQSSYIMHR